jgi:RimJ/RimL family protein N-acetyltransferase
MYFRGFKTLRETENYLLDCERMWALEHQKDWEFGITLKDSGELIGACDFCIEEGGVELGWILAKDHWKKGYAAEAARAMIDHVFRNSDFNRIFARCDSENYGSWRVMEKLGMTREAVFRKARPNGNDEYVYAILREEWERV